MSIDTRNCLQFVDSLDKAAELYNAMTAPLDNTFFVDKQIKNALIGLSTLGASTFYPLVFAMQIKQYDEADILKMLKAVETLVVRNFVVGGLTAKKYEQTFSAIARQVSKEKISIAEILELISNDTNDDAKFQRDLVSVVVKAAPVAKYILREIEDFESGEKEIKKDNHTINLEHIMPKKIDKWSIDANFHKDNLYRLANQALLLEEFNKSISNNPFKDKKIMYQKSEVATTKMLSDYDEWTEKEMNSRERFLCDKMFKRWAIVK
jgi:hypothetical protein